MSNQLAQAWLLSALADLKNIEHILGDDFLTHIAAFHAQQCVEKCFKAVIVEQSGKAPRVHSTLTLYGLIRNKLPLDVDTDLLTDFDDIYIIFEKMDFLTDMQTHQPPYATEEHSATHTIVHLGAGTCRELERYLTAQPARLLLVEADPQRADDLQRRTQSLPQVEVRGTAVTTDATASILYRYNLPDVNSLHAPSGLWHLFPGLKLMDQIEVGTVSPADLIAPLQLQMQQENRLIIDTPGEELPILKALQESDHLHRFKYLYLHCGRDSLYETSVPGMQIVEWLQEEGFDLMQADDGDDPDRPLWILKRNQLQLRYRDLLQEVERLQQALEQSNRQSAERQQQIKTLTQARDEYKNLADERQVQLEKLSEEHAATLETLNKSKSARDVIASEKAELASRISNFESQIEKLQQDCDAKAKALEQANQEKTRQTKLANERQTQLEKLKAENTANLEALNQTKAAKETLSQEKNDLASRISHLTSRISNLESDLEKLKQERDAKAKALEQANQEKTKQTKLGNDRQTQLEKLKAENTANLEALNQAKAAKDALAHEKSDLASRNSNLESDLEKLKQERDAKAKALEQVNKEQAKQTKLIKEQQAKLEKLEKSKNQLESQLAEAEQTQHQMNEEMVKAEVQIDFIKELLLTK
jgi:chromosome segregation ATPase